MKRRVLTGVAVAAMATGIQAAEPFDAAAAFGAREDVRDVSLSPDGKLLALIRAKAGGGDQVDVVPVAGGMPKGIMNSGAGQSLSRCDWTGPTRLVCRVHAVSTGEGMKIGFNRLFAVDANGRNLQPLNRTSDRALQLVQNGGEVIDLLPESNGNEVLITRRVVPTASTDTRLFESRDGLAVERLDTVTMAGKTVETARFNAIEFITDGHGNVRVIGDQTRAATGYALDRISYCYRRVGSGACEPLSVVTPASGFSPYAVDRDLNVVYGFDRHEGRLALFKVALDGSMKRELVLADPNVDVDRLIRIGRQRRVVGASFATERRQAVMFDPALKKLSVALGKALPNLPKVAFIDATTDESKLLLIASSDNDPGRYYLYTRATGELNELLPVRPQLNGVKLATMKPVTFPAADGTTIPGYLTLPPGSDGKNLPAIVMPHGGPGARDEWGFDWWAQFYANRGFAVLQPNFRGSTGYGDAWFQKNGFQSWRTAIGDVNDGGRWLIKQGITAPGKLAIAGWSYGGYAALQSSVLDPDLFKAVVAVAPVTDLETLRQEFAQFTNFTAIDAFIGHGPHVREGSPAQNAGRIKAPVMMFHGDMDTNVGVGEARLMERKLKDAGKSVELTVYKGLNHQLPDGDARADMLRKSDAFLRKSLGL